MNPRRRRMRLRYTCHYSGRVSVIRTTYPVMPWMVTSGGQIFDRFFTHDEAVTSAHEFAHARAVRAIQDGAA